MKAPLYLAQTQPGFETIAADEITQRLGTATVHKTERLRGKNGLITFEYNGPPQDLLELRTIEDLFAVVAHVRDLLPTRAGLPQLERTALKANLEPALQLARQLRPGKPVRGVLPFRVVSRQLGHTAYRRVDAQVAIEKGILLRSDHKWKLSKEGAFELWLTLTEGEALLALRLSDDSLRHRRYKLEHLPASLRPSAAGALVWLTRPQPSDVFLDPMCGAGTILIERAHFERYELLLGGDNRQEALQVALTNIGPRYKPIEVRQWDARQLPLDAGSISAGAVNMPFGTKLGTPEENKELYPAVLREVARVLRPGGRFAAFSGDGRTLQDAARRINGLRRRESFGVQILGHGAYLMVLERI